MKIACFLNNWVAFEVLKWLVEQSQPISVVVIHPQEEGLYRDEIEALAIERIIPVLVADDFDSSDMLAELKKYNCDLFLSIGFNRLFSDALLELPACGCINMHNGLLPFNRGTYANIWSIVDATPAGATLHYIDSGIDTGDIISRKKVSVTSEDTGETLYRKIEKASIELFKETWPEIKHQNASRTTQALEAGTYHRKKDVESIDEIYLDHTYTARNLLNIIRARTFGTYDSAYFKENGEKYFVRIRIDKEYKEYD